VQLPFGHKEFVGNVKHDAATVARFRIATAGTAMSQIDENLKAVFDDFVGAFAIDVAHEADTAGIVLVVRLIQAFPGYASCRQDDSPLSTVVPGRGNCAGRAGNRNRTLNPSIWARFFPKRMIQKIRIKSQTEL
jgi:hypothetical protein